jgi:hypothetical protein
MDVYMLSFREKKAMASSRLFNNIGKRLWVVYFSRRIWYLGRIGIGLAVAGGVANSMLYNGN